MVNHLTTSSRSTLGHCHCRPHFRGARIWPSNGRATVRRVLVIGLSMTVLLTVTSRLWAQAAAPSSSDGVTLSEVVVTGSLLKADGLTSTSPLLSVSSQEFNSQGTTNVETLLNNLPQVAGSQAMTQSTYGAPGIATVNLRDLGPQRTEVLIDGKRLMPGDPLQPFADVNFIPSAMVSSVDVLTGGASTAYGSDAVGGVVNFKLQRDLNGIVADYQFSADQHDNHDGVAQSELKAAGLPIPGSQLDGFIHDASLAAGMDTPDKHGNVTAYLGYRSTDPVSESTRDFSACGIGTITVTEPFDTHVCTGSSTSAFGRFKTDGLGSGLSANPNGTATFVKYTSALAYNSNQDTDLQRDDTRYTAGLLAHYALTPQATVYADFMFMNDHTDAQIAPAGIVSTQTYTINCNNPLLSASEAPQLCGANAGSSTADWSGTIAKRVVVDGLPRYYDLNHTDYRAVIGLKGDVGGGWSYDVYGQYGEVDYRDVLTNDVSISHVQDALLVRSVNGTPTCVSGNSGCAPLNIFQLGQISNAAANYIFANGLQDGNVTQEIVSATLNGDLSALGVQSPLAARPASLAIGTEYRRDAIALSSSANIVDGDLASFGPTPASLGSTNVKELFIESLVPIISDKPWVKDFSLDLADRYSDYNLSGGAKTYKASLIFAPDGDISFRGGYNRAVRAPNVVELFAPTALSTASVTDSCAGTSPTATLAQCEHTGVKPLQYGNIPTCSSNYCSVLDGGNAALKPETADTVTVGFVLTPSLLPNFSLAADYFNVDVMNLIGQVPVPLIFSQCLNTDSQFYCNMIKRDSNGSLASTTGYILNGNLNTGFLRTSGVDVDANYRFNLDKGSLAFTMDGSWTVDREISPVPGQPAYDCAGLYGPTCGVPTPKWRHNFRTTWETPWNLLVSLNWRFIGSSSVDINEGNPVFSGVTGGKPDIADARIGSVSYFDLSGAVTIRKNCVVRFGVTNIFDKDPPIVDNFNLGINSQYGNANTFSSLYATLGRTIFAGITGKF